MRPEDPGDIVQYDIYGTGNEDFQRPNEHSSFIEINNDYSAPLGGSGGT